MAHRSTHAPAPSAPGGCVHHGCTPGGREPFATPANVVTVVRTVAAVVLAVLALGERSESLLLASLAVYWVGDILDGAVARWTDTETRVGAVLDVLCDRLCSSLFYVGWAVLNPDDVLPIAVFLVQFMVVDCLLSLAFLAWPLRSPNYFDLVDRTVFALNWSKVGKATNSGALALLLIFTDSLVLPLLLTVSVLGVKCWSLVRVAHLWPEVAQDCAERARSAGLAASAATG